MADNQFTPRPQVQSTANPTPSQVTARPVQLGLAAPADNSVVSGLVKGLSSFNPALAAFADVQISEQQDRNAVEAKRIAEEERARAQTVQPTGKLTDEVPPELGYQGTFKAIQRESFSRGIADRAAVGAKSDIISQYNESRDLPDFNLDSFIQKARQDHLNGLPADMVGPVGEHLTSLEASLRGDYEKVRLGRLDVQREQNVSAALTANIDVGAQPDKVAQTYFQQVLPTIMGQGKTKAEAAQYLLRRLQTVSDQTGGNPDLFDALTKEKGPDGFTVFDSNTALQPQIQAAKARAQAQLDHKLTDAAMEGNVLARKDLDERLMSNPESITLDQLMSLSGKFNVFQTDDQINAYWRQVLSARASPAADTNLLGMAKDGTLMMADLSDQKKVMKLLTAPVVQGLQKSIASGDTTGVAVLADSLIEAHRTAGSNAVSEPVQGLFKFIGKAKSGDSPTPQFLAGVEVYRRMANNQNLRDDYFDEDARNVMDSFILGREGGADPKSAYTTAYESISPEGKRRAEAFKQTPEYKEKLAGVSKAVVGSSFVPRWLGGNGRPENQGELLSASQEYATNLMKRNPSMSEADALENATRWAERSFVLDETSHNAVRVPDGIAPEAAQKAISAYTKKVAGDLRLSDRIDGVELSSRWGLSFMPDNTNQGTYRVFQTYNGVPQALVGPVNIKDLVEQHRRDTMWQPADAAVLKQAEIDLNAGKQFSDSGLQAAISKARLLKVQPELVKRLDDAELASARSILASRVRTDYQPDTAALFRNDRRTPTDPKQTASSAQRLLDTANGGSTGLAASLITLGEGVMLKAYDDPAQGAGKNIGMGYNLKANADRASRDLLAAGVPEHLVQGVIAGREQLSQEQAERLTMVSVGRYEALAREQVDSLQPNFWTKLQPQQRAVLTDIAYQTGNVGQFKQAISAMVSGDEAAFREHSKVFYTNRKGERVEDVRRNALRDSMLSGPSFWQSVLSKHGSAPSVLDVATVNVAQQGQAVD